MKTCETFLSEIKERLAKSTPGLHEFVDLIKTQDNRGTARPLVFDLQLEVVDFLPSGHGDHFSAAKDCPHLTESPEDLGLDPNEILSWRYRWEHRESFLTKEGYEEHLRLNRHNYPDRIRCYVRHAFLNPEANRVHEWLEHASRSRTDIETLVKMVECARDYIGNRCNCAVTMPHTKCLSCAALAQLDQLASSGEGE